MSVLGVVRRAFTLGRGVALGLSEDSLQREPLELFGEWFRDATESSLLEPTAMTLATCGADARPAARMVLLKSFDDDGFVFYTNYRSRKAAELTANPHAALVLYWQPLLRQVRIEGSVERLTAAQSTPYFSSRPRGSRIGAWASRQSEVLGAREDLVRRVAQCEQRFSGDDVPLPEFWGGFRVRPEMIEFWQGRASRLHDRARFERQDAAQGGGWKGEWLYP